MDIHLITINCSSTTVTISFIVMQVDKRDDFKTQQKHIFFSTVHIVYDIGGDLLLVSKSSLNISVTDISINSINGNAFDFTSVAICKCSIGDGQQHCSITCGHSFTNDIFSSKCRDYK